MRREDLPREYLADLPEYNRGAPLRRYVAIVGLLGLAQTAWLLANGDLSLGVAGGRAAIILVVVLIVDKLLSVALESLVRNVARQSPRAVVTDVTRLEEYEDNLDMLTSDDYQ